MFTIETIRWIIKKFTLDMAYDVHINSLDIDDRRFVLDEVSTFNEYVKEAVNAFLTIIPKKFGIHKVLGICLKEHITSMAVLKSTGFIKIYEELGLYRGEEREIFKSVWKNRVEERK